MFKFIAVFLTVVLFLIFSIPLLILEWFIGFFNKDLKSSSSLAIVQWIFRVVLWITGVEVITKGLENVPDDKAVLYVANHRSYFDVLLTYVRVKRPTGYIAKVEMLKFPLLRDWMNNLHCLFLDRANIKEGLKTILAGIEKINSGISICIFPEGTRNSVNHTFLPFHGGSFKIAEKTGCAIIPISINESASIFEDQFPRMKKTKVVLQYGTPIYMDQLEKEDRKKIGDYVSSVIKEMYEDGRKILKS